MTNGQDAPIITLTYGTIAGRTISDLYRVFPGFFVDHYLIVTVLDSSQDVRSFVCQNGGGKGIGLQYFGRAVVIPPAGIGAFCEGNYLHAFDEMYLVPERSIARMNVAWDDQFTSDHAVFNECVPDFVSEAMSLLNATRFVSDGLGLNYVCESAAIGAEVTARLA